MSQQNVDLILSLQVWDVDLVPFFRDDERMAEAMKAVAPLYHPDIEVVHRLLGGDRVYFGLEGMWASWLDWLSPWESYHAHLEDAIDCGEKVLIIVRDSGRRQGSTVWVDSNNAAVWTIRDGQIARAEFYADRDWARRDAGLADS
jgi:ketosteroid isomerase-like protein